VDLQDALEELSPDATPLDGPQIVMVTSAWQRSPGPLPAEPAEAE
jgi:hypothetical protein